MSWNQVVTSTNQGWRKKELIRNVRQQPQAREIASDQVAIEYLSVVNNQQDYLHEKKCSLRVNCNLSYCRKEAWKIQVSTGFEPVAPDTKVFWYYQLSW